jgi:signal transduction histidine kinase
VERVRGTGLDITLERSGRPFAVSGAAGLTVYRIVQEALTNALKHADELASVDVRVAFREPDISVRVTDDGRTRVPVPALGAGHPDGNGNGRRAASGGHGVAGMAERAAAFGGTFEAGPRPAGGWEVMATLRDCKAPTSA